MHLRGTLRGIPAQLAYVYETEAGLTDGALTPRNVGKMIGIKSGGRFDFEWPNEPDGWVSLNVVVPGLPHSITSPPFHSSKEVFLTLQTNGVIEFDAVPPVGSGPKEFPIPLSQHYTAARFIPTLSAYGILGAPSIDFIARFLDKAVSYGFGGIRVWDWEHTGYPSVRLFTKLGDPTIHYDKLGTLLTLCSDRKVSVDVTLETSKFEATKKSEEGYDIGPHKKALRTLLRDYGAHPTLRIVDADNEAGVRGAGGHGSPDTGHTSPGRAYDLLGVAAEIHPTCLVSFSVSEDGDGIIPWYQRLKERGRFVPVLLPHFARVPGWGRLEAEKAIQLRKAFPGVPIHHQEPARNGHSTTPPGGWPLSEFTTACDGAFSAGSVGFCLHGDYCFDVTGGFDPFLQMDPTELAFCDWLKQRKY